MSTLPADALLIATAQLDAVAGDVAANADAVRRARDEAALKGADLVVFPELFLSGPHDAQRLAPRRVAEVRAAAEELAAESAAGPGLLVGAPWAEGGAVYNSVLLLAEGRIAGARHKVALAGTEAADFASGPLPGPMAFRGVRLGLVIGADLYGPDVAECLAETGAEILLAPAALPYRRGAADARLGVAVARVVETGLPLMTVDLVGGSGADVFAGASFALGANRALVLQFPSFLERVRVSQWERYADGWHCGEAPLAHALEGDEADYAACVLGLRDLVRKAGHAGVVLDLAAGLGAALCAALAVDALGPEHVHGLGIAPAAPGAGAEPARRLGLESRTVSSGRVAEEIAAALGISVAEAMPAARAALLEAAAEASGGLLLAASDRTSAALGEDAPAAAGAFHPLKDLSRTEVVRLAGLRNRWRPTGAKGPGGEVIPAALIEAASQIEGASLAELEAVLAHLDGAASDLPAGAAGLAGRIARRLAASERAGRPAPAGLRLAAEAGPRGPA